jgi:hypothetical protein
LHTRRERNRFGSSRLKFPDHLIEYIPASGYKPNLRASLRKVEREPTPNTGGCTRD